MKYLKLVNQAFTPDNDHHFNSQNFTLEKRIKSKRTGLWQWQILFHFRPPSHARSHNDVHYINTMWKPVGLGWHQYTDLFVLVSLTFDTAKANSVETRVHTLYQPTTHNLNNDTMLHEQAIPYTFVSFKHCKFKQCNAKPGIGKCNFSPRITCLQVYTWTDVNFLN